MECFVKSCTNKSHEGGFCGNVCVPCTILAKDIQNGILKHSYNFTEGIVQFIADNWREVIKQSKFIIVGNTYHIQIGPGKPYKIHIDHIVPNIYGENMIIYRWYGKHKKWWHTCIEEESILKIKIERCSKL